MKTIISVSLLLLTYTLSGQTLDQKAYNHVWDNLELMYSDHNSEDEIITVLKTPRLATWGAQTSVALKDLARFASIIPKDSFQIDADNTYERLDQVYQSIVLSVKLKPRSAKDQQALDLINGELTTAINDHDEKRRKFEQDWNAHYDRMSDAKKEYEELERRDFESTMGMAVGQAYNKVLELQQQTQSYLSPTDFYGEAVAKLIVQKNASNAFKRQGEYNTNFIALNALKQSNCVPESMSEISLAMDTKSTKIRSKGWNLNGSWDKNFFKIGGGINSSNYNYFFQGDKKSISLKFCNTQFIEVYPGDWFNTTFLRALDEGRIEYREDSPNFGKPVFGPEGLIPRMMKGVLVARKIEFEAVLDEEQLSVVKSAKGGGGGFKIGPFKIGGSGSSVKFTEEETKDKGKYRLVADLGYPVIFAILTQNTKRNLQP